MYKCSRFQWRCQSGEDDEAPGQSAIKRKQTLSCSFWVGWFCSVQVGCPPPPLGYRGRRNSGPLCREPRVLEVPLFAEGESATLRKTLIAVAPTCLLSDFPSSPIISHHVPSHHVPSHHVPFNHVPSCPIPLCPHPIIILLVAQASQPSGQTNICPTKNFLKKKGDGEEDDDRKKRKKEKEGDV